MPRPGAGRAPWWGDDAGVRSHRLPGAIQTIKGGSWSKGPPFPCLSSNPGARPSLAYAPHLQRRLSLQTRGPHPCKAEPPSRDTPRVTEGWNRYWGRRCPTCTRGP